MLVHCTLEILSMSQSTAAGEESRMPAVMITAVSGTCTLIVAAIIVVTCIIYARRKRADDTNK